MLLVEEKNMKGFCSEACILEFYTPVLEHIAEEEKKLRFHHNIDSEEVLKYRVDEKLLQKTFESPSEIWAYQNEIGEEFFTFIYHGEWEEHKDIYVIIMTFIFDQVPSFVLFQTVTQNEEFVSEYRVGGKIDELDDFLKERALEQGPEAFLDPKVIEMVEQKKSSYLAKLMEQRTEEDIPVEEFSVYESYVQDCLEEPDEVFQHDDEDGEKIFTYIKSFEREDVTFFYFVLCIHVTTDVEANEDILVPIISFPSQDGELYQNYKKGECLAGGLKN